MASIMVVGLGPGTLGQMNLETYDLLFSGARVFLRTGTHPCVKELSEKGLHFETFDKVYDSSLEFSEVYQKIADSLITVAEHEDIIYAVPGHPRVAERSVSILLEMADAKGINVEIKTAMSFLDQVFSVLGIDPVDGVAVIDGSHELQRPNYSQWIIICQVYNKMIASECKLDLMKYYPDETMAYVLNSAGIAGVERVTELPLFELDQTPEFDHLTCVVIAPLRQEEQPPSWDKLLQTMKTLRGPEGCPWDKEQTHLSLKPYLLEETYEVLDALDLGDMYKLCEELGDLLLQIVFHAQLAEEIQAFGIEDVISELVSKLVRRHPHVFGNDHAENSDEVLVNWDRIKEEEKGGHKSIFDNLTKGLPATLYAKKVQSRASKVGFDWPELSGAVSKVREELEEFLQADNSKDQAAELGDLLFACTNLSRFINADPEIILRNTSEKFIRRFNFIEQYCIEHKQRLEDMDITELDELWELAKKTMKYVEKL